MEENATTPDSGEGTTADAAQTEIMETAPIERTAPESSDEAVSFDINDFPEEQREIAQQAYEKINRDFKSMYTRKTQELSAREKVREAELSNYRSQIDQYNSMIQDALSSPERMEYYQRLLNQDYAPKIDASQFESLEDYHAYQEQIRKAELERLRLESQQQTAQQIQQAQRQAKWDSAFELAMKEPSFVRYEQIVKRNISSDPKYLQMYNSGKSESAIINQALKDFKDLIRDDLEEVKQATISEFMKKKESSTQAPVKPAGNIKPSGEPQTREQIIAKIQNQFGPMIK